MRPFSRARRHAPYPAPGRRNIAAIATAIGVLAMASTALAQSVTGGFCRAGQFRLEGSDGTVRKQELWSYQGGSAPFHPVFGWVDMACWNTGGGVPVDIAKRSWFAVAGPSGGPASAAEIHFAEPRTLSGGSSTGVTAEGARLYGSAGPNHDCVFEVHVWQDTCPNR